MRHWRTDPTGNFSAAVDDPRLFDFLEQVTGAKRNNWVRTFETAADIVKTLKHQWAAMFAESLHEHLDRDVIPVRPNRQALTSQYVKLLDGAAAAIDMMGVSLISIGRAAGIEEALRSAGSREVPIRVVIMSKDAPGAKERGAEEYGEDELVAELDGAESMWHELTAGIATAEVRQYRTRAAMFFFRVDDVRFVSLYPPKDAGTNAPTFEFPGIGEAANYFQGSFNALWEDLAP
jgi:hypothetical protein